MLEGLFNDRNRYEVQIPLSQEAAMALLGATRAPGGGYLLEPAPTATAVPVQVGGHSAGRWLPTSVDVRTPVGKPTVYLVTFIQVDTPDRQPG